MKRANGRRSSTSAIPFAAGSKLSQNGSTSTTLAASTSTSQVIAYARAPALSRVAQPDRDRQPPAGRPSRVRPRVDGVQGADREAGGERLGDAAQHRVAARAGERDLEREGERQRR